MNTTLTVGKELNLTVILSLVCALIMLAPLQSAGGKGTRETAKDRGESLYMSNCEACHMSGSNVINPEKELVRSDKLTSRKIFKEYISQKHGYMPAFSDIANDTADLKDLYTFVRKLKMTSWDYPATEPTPGRVEPKQPEPPTDGE